MSFQWENTKNIGLKHSSRWGHASVTLPNDCLVQYGGYASKLFTIIFRFKVFV